MVKCFRLQLVDILGLIFLVTLLFFRGSMMGDPGVGWHLKAGEWIESQRSIPEIDPFLEPVDGYLPWVDDQWLSQLIAFRLFSIGGMPLLHLLAALICVAPFLYVLPELIREKTSARVLVFLALFLAALQASVQWIFRPVIVSFLLFSVVYRIASQRIVDESKPLGSWWWGLPLLFLFWANLHPGFLLGGWVVFVAVGCRKIRKPMETIELAIVGLFCAGATWFNPYYLDLHRSIFRLLGNPYFMSLNQEWHPPVFSEAAFFPFVLLLAILGAGLVVLRPRGFRKFDIIMLLSVGAAACMQRRYLPFLGIVAAVPLAAILEEFRKRFFEKSGGSLFGRLFNRQELPGTPDGVFSSVLVGVLGVYVFLFHALPNRSPEFSDIPQSYPYRAVAMLAQQPGPGRILHSPDIGGFLTWKLWPEKLAFIDDRNQVVPEERYREVLGALRTEPGWQETLKKYRFRWALLSGNDPLSSMLASDPGWRVLNRNESEQSQLFERLEAAEKSNDLTSITK